MFRLALIVFKTASVIFLLVVMTRVIYSYKWAEVLCPQIAFSRFERRRLIFNAKTVWRLFEPIFSKWGGSKERWELFVAFRGRELSGFALLLTRA